MKVREVLTPLLKEALKRLCQRRGLSEVGTKDEIRRRLAHSYHGDMSALVHDLRRKDMLTVASEHSDSVEFPARLWELPVSELREVCLAVFEERYKAHKGPAGAATEDGGEVERESERPDGGDFDIAFFATGCGGLPGVGHVDEKSLAEMAKDADSVTVLSAYYVPKVLETIAGACRGDVKIVLNGLGGRRLNKQVRDLEKLQDKLRRRSRSAKIRLAFAEGVFHTKLYVFGTKRGAVAWIGSANATKAGLNGRNEEVLVRMEPTPHSVLDYADSAWSRAMPVKRCRQKVSSLIAFFRTGMLYYKPYATLQMTLNPFRRLMATLPAAEKRKITPFRSDYADEEGGIGAFNLKRVFEGAPEEESREQPVERQRVELRRYAVETCYGYWVAEPFIEGVDRMLVEASADKRRLLNVIRERMKTERDAIVEAYETYLEDVRRMLDDEGVNWQAHESEKLFQDTSAIKRRVDSLAAVLDTEPRLARHCQAFVSSEVPEIWEDDASCASFAGSFFDSLAIASSAQRRSGSARRILDSLALSGVKPEDIRAALKDALRKNGWYEKNFGSTGARHL